ncbi:MAG: hypothetical protein KDC73_11070 [Ignavibacteriae bacterium]|nr:hypothetical protein [Ignavibacteriota bacterium]MCB0725231.1 hypothetical protein [Ignavibacteriota bacterium]MCB9242445.1 hypothetical protein [Ignavibacteriales bacterium]
MDKYLVQIPYSYLRYGTKSGYVYAESRDEAYDLAVDDCMYNEDYDDDGDSGETECDYNNVEVILDESDISEDEIPSRQQYYNTPTQYSQYNLPDYFLSEVNTL